ncbi:MAG TPA: YfiR family protein, partial [Desulfobacteria bacterium]|nr:YfiR family protein [Desulfobacteria bacterium]
GKKVAVFSLTKPEALDDSFQVLFVGGEDTQAVRELFKRVNGKPILTVSDQKGFIGLGGMVLFKDPEALRKGGKNEKRFIIDLSMVRKSRLKIRSRLLRMSDIVYDLDPANLKTGD